MLSTIVAGALSLAAIALIYRSWRTRALAFFYLGSGVLLASCIGWSFSQGWEHGLVYALCIPALLVWPFISANQTVLATPKHTPSPKSLNVSLKTAWVHIGHYLVVLVLLLVTSLVTSLAICLRFPSETAGKLASVIVLMPILWGLLIYHYFAVSNKVKALIAYFILAALSSAVLMYVPL
ncbi:hypothetical protein [Alteromonas sp. KUL49]|uniref:hypothetical protein n=1 Tax=Alteromonas sp. KUL49 TaxID=2480798 RepID=UPI00102EE807|nr:hypothetical protein [Alteromonas sp. KUL49]TAP36830.1 hypothetical protein EYS00_17070 [Alteromonas sp. KUL49]GEA13089.1 hypothetical protein KUL49_34640 [Alteromonas sp. KUL49]